MTERMNIGEAAAAAGVSQKMVRHYERIGLLPETPRDAAGYRRYSPYEVSVLRFIGRSRHLGFSLPQIAELIGLWSDTERSSREVKAVAERHLASLEEKRREIDQMVAGLQELLQQCPGDDTPHCAILESLSQSRLDQFHPSHRPRLKKAAPDETEATGGGSAIDLMAWMRAVRVHHPPG